MAKHRHHDVGKCPECEGDGEFAGPGLTSGNLAWCIACRGSGLADNACDGCGHEVTLDTKRQDTWTEAHILVHIGCDTGARWFDRAALSAV